MRRRLNISVKKMYIYLISPYLLPKMHGKTLTAEYKTYNMEPSNNISPNKANVKRLRIFTVSSRTSEVCWIQFKWTASHFVYDSEGLWL